jgi:hypothetical protein
LRFVTRSLLACAHGTFRETEKSRYVGIHQK